MKALHRPWKNATLLVLCLTALPFLSCLPPKGQVFSFVVIADPHVNAGTDNGEKLQYCVDWIKEHHDDEDKTIAMAFVVGDMGGGYGGLARDILAGLDEVGVPYMPLIGDNDVHWSHGGSGTSAHYAGGLDFEATFGNVYDELSTTMENWHKAPGPVENPETGGALSHFHNFSFDYQGVHFLCLDWCTRKDQVTEENPLQSEQADLHDFPGGTLPWFRNDLENCAREGAENIVMLSHHPMHVFPLLQELPLNAGAFDADELGKIKDITNLYKNNVYADIAGHYHIDLYEKGRNGSYDVRVVWGAHIEPEARMQLVRVYHDARRNVYSYHHETLFPEAELATRGASPSGEAR